MNRIDKIKERLILVSKVQIEFDITGKADQIHTAIEDIKYNISKNFRNIDNIIVDFPEKHNNIKPSDLSIADLNSILQLNDLEGNTMKLLEVRDELVKRLNQLKILK